ncbi:uncharacterized protein LOC130999367 isoform X2 [Salvia miltiorrhiza]|uniref:uncharacterized protein LOC130999367 isoform X2 n=1 Tax=Salvia miltiorrhiza TaxID=226208 RepID=UPI0025ACE190|nr:uncharacterized protein LOC130999367 isoform X2 [Salvia miltiorrhiza]
MASRTQSNGRSFELELQLEQEVENKPPTVEKDAEDSIESSPNREMTTYSQHYFGSIRDGFSISIIELGAGTSLPGLVAAKVGADVTLTDDLSKAEVLSNMRRVCNINDLKCKVLGVTWGVFEAPIFTLHPKIILGADVLYDTSAFDDLFSTVTFLLQKCPDSVFITTYHNRSGHHLIEFLMEKWRLKCTKLLDGFSLLPPHKASKLSGDIQLAELFWMN